MGTGFAIGLLIVICGFIAYSGDLLGRRLGKRRLTLWGLRPRHTAVVFTVITGMLIAVLSLAAMVGLSAGVRRALLYGEGLLWDNWHLREENRGAQRWNKHLQAQNGQLFQRVQQQNSDNRRLEAKNRELRRHRDQLDLSLRKQVDRIARLEAERRRIETRNETLVRQSRRLIASNADLGRTVHSRQLQLVDARRRISDASIELAKTQESLKEAKASYIESIKQAGQKFGRARDEAAALADKPLIARTDEELARVVLPEGSSYASIQDVLENLLQRAQAEVIRRQRAARATPPPAALVLVPRWAERHDVVNAVMEGIQGDLIRSDGGAMVLRALADENTPPGHPVPVRILRKPNALAFRKGEEIGRVDLNGSQKEGALLRTLLGFLQQSVRARALSRGVIPGTDGRVGEIQYDPLLDAVKKVRDIGGPARVGVVAAEDVWSVGPLQIDFYVLPGEQRVAGDR